MATYDDSLQARIATDTPDHVRQVLLHAWSRDLPALKELLATPGAANVRDPKTGETPLHSVVRGCGARGETRAVVGGDTTAQAEDKDDDDDDDEDGVVADAKACVQELFFSGAIWNDVDDRDETPGCTAWRLGRRGLYRMFVDAGVRAELLFGLMDDGYEKLSSGGDGGGDDDDDDDQDQDQEKDGKEESSDAAALDASAAAPPDDATTDGAVEAASTALTPATAEKPVTSEEYLESKIKFDDDRLLDDDLNGVMMAWETDIMRRTVDALLPEAPSQDHTATTTNKRILNIGFGMGIIDRLFAAHTPSRHHIIEAHPDVIRHARRLAPTSGFDLSPWEASSSPAPRTAHPAHRLFPGRWQDVVDDLVRRGELYDAIYFDTFAEDYAQLRRFLADYVPFLLDAGGRFGFFNGLGADRRVCYDVYARVVELHAAEAGLDVDWLDVPVDMARLAHDGEGEWEGVRRRYWTLDTYKMPICTFMG